MGCVSFLAIVAWRWPNKDLLLALLAREWLVLDVSAEIYGARRDRAALFPIAIRKGKKKRKKSVAISTIQDEIDNFKSSFGERKRADQSIYLSICLPIYQSSQIDSRHQKYTKYPRHLLEEWIFYCVGWLIKKKNLRHLLRITVTFWRWIKFRFINSALTCTEKQVTCSCSPPEVSVEECHYKEWTADGHHRPHKCKSPISLKAKIFLLLSNVGANKKCFLK